MVIPIYEIGSEHFNDDFLIVISFWVLGICFCICIISCHYISEYCSKKDKIYHLFFNNELIL